MTGTLHSDGFLTSGTGRVNLDIVSTQTDQGWIPEQTLGDRLMLIRRKLNLTQRQAADQSGVPFGSWQGLEDGRDARGLDWKITSISETFGVDRAWLMWGVGMPTGSPHNRTDAKQVTQTLPASRTPLWAVHDMPCDLLKVA